MESGVVRFPPVAELAMRRASSTRVSGGELLVPVGGLGVVVGQAGRERADQAAEGAGPTGCGRRWRHKRRHGGNPSQESFGGAKKEKWRVRKR